MKLGEKQYMRLLAATILALNKCKQKLKGVGRTPFESNNDREIGVGRGRENMFSGTVFWDHANTAVLLGKTFDGYQQFRHGFWVFERVFKEGTRDIHNICLYICEDDELPLSSKQNTPET